VIPVRDGLLADSAQWFPVESSATVHMLSQLTKTIKLALKSTQEERAILRARSAVQRFPVVEWRQRLEDFQRRSINISRSTAGEHAYGYDMAGGYHASGLYAHQEGSTTSLAMGSAPPSPMPGYSRRLSAMSANSAMGPPEQQGGGYDHSAPMAASNNLSANGASYHNRFDSKGNRKQNRESAESFYDEDPNASPLYYDKNGRRQSSKPRFGNEDDEGYASQASSDVGDTTVVGSSESRPRDAASQSTYDNFLAAANRQIAKQSKGAKDPFVEQRQSMDAGNFAPSRPFTEHSRMSSFDSISSIMDEKGGSSPLNKAIETVSMTGSGLRIVLTNQFTDSDGEVATSFVQKLQNLSADNSKGDLCIEKFLMKSEKAFFTEVKRDKINGGSQLSKVSGTS
jgi:alpha-1,3-glucan synthase